MRSKRKNISEKIYRLISDHSSFQKKKIDSFHKDLIKKNFEEMEFYLSLYKKFLTKNNIKMNQAVAAYFEMCRDMFTCHIKFLRTGKYPVQKLADAKKNVYYNKTKMKSYMVGLAISQFFWSTHYKMFKHLQTMINKNINTRSYLEIGPGHGLFSFYSINKLKKLTHFTAVDISKTSLNLKINFIKSLISKNKLIDYEFIEGDFLKIKQNKKKYDLIVCGEVLEHVKNPNKLLNNINVFLNKNGKVFISTCINCPAIDHVNQFNKVEDITKLFKKSKFKIISQKILPVEKVNYTNALKKKITINYSAILKKN